MTDLLFVDQMPQRTSHLSKLLDDHGYSVASHSTIPDLTEFTHLRCVLCHDSYLDQLNQFLTLAPVIVFSDQADVKAAVQCIKRGAFDYLAFPADVDEIIASVERASASATSTKELPMEQVPMVGSSEVMQTLKKTIAKVAPTNSTVLIQGQSGTGKELVARALHAGSTRAHAPLISINCATVPENLIETELFGLEQFESDSGSHKGLVEAAEGGTLFLDEIGELPLTAQARLLRVVEGENRKVGSSTTHAVDVRVIAATHRNIQDLTANQQFREDLFYRLNVVSLNLPSLKQRRDDIVEIAEFLLARTITRLNKPNLNFDASAIQAMLAYHWPGNVRELENAIERAVILADENSDITQSLLAIEPSEKHSADPELPVDPDQTSLEDYFVRFVLDNQEQLTETELAEKLGISRKSLWERRQRLNIPRRKTRKRGPRRDASGD